MKKDLTELKDTVKEESVHVSTYVSSTASAVTSTATFLKDTAVTAVNSLALDEEEDQEGDKDVQEKDGEKTDKPSDDESMATSSLTIAASEKMASVFNRLVEVLSPLGFDDDDEVIIGMSGLEGVSRERWEVLLASVQGDPMTFCHEPEGPPDDYESWLETFSLIDHERQVEQLLNSVPDIDKFYRKLVPKELTHDMFWHRYFYRVQQLVNCERMRMEKNKIKDGDEEVAEDDQQSVNPDVKVVDVKLLAEEVAREMSPVSTDGSNVSSTNGSSSTAKSSEWEKADLNEIVDEAEKRLAERLAAQPMDTKSDEELNEWEFE